MLKERPILFSGEMVNAILAGRKTQTRRVLKYQPIDVLPMEAPNRWVTLDTLDPNHGKVVKCRYGIPGDHLWIREKWKIQSLMDGEPMTFRYAADDAICEENSYADCIQYESWYENIVEQSTNELVKLKWPDQDGDGIYRWDNSPLKWRPSIHMPRWASRITLEIVDIRAERVQEISEADAEAEGIHLLGLPETERHNHPRKHIVAFRAIWDSINAKKGFGWDTNPWVWVIEFGLIKKETL